MVQVSKIDCSVFLLIKAEHGTHRPKRHTRVRRESRFKTLLFTLNLSLRVFVAKLVLSV